MTSPLPPQPIQPPGQPLTSPAAPIRRETPYLQIAGLVRSHITTDNLQPGDRLPSLTDLAHQFGVSIPTVEKALCVLIGERMVEVRPGQGYHVSQALWAPTGADRARRLTRTGRIYPPGEGATILGADLVGAPDYVASALALGPEDMVIRRTRVTRIDGAVVSLSVSWIPDRYAGDVPELLRPEPILNGTIGAICRATGIRIAAAPAGRDQLLARGANMAEAETLRVNPGDPVLATAHWFYGAVPPTDAPVILEFGESAIPAGRPAVYEYDLSVPLSPGV